MREAMCAREYADDLDLVQPGLGKSVRMHTWKPHSMSQREIVFGAGSGSTGTTSLAVALWHVGMKGWHWNLDDPWMRGLLELLQGQPVIQGRTQVKPFTLEQRQACPERMSSFQYTSLPGDIDFVLDMPIPEVFVQLYISFPKAKFLLSKRPELEWAENRLDRHSGQGTLLPVQDPCGLFIDGWEPHRLARLEWLKNRFIRCVVPPERLFTVDLFNPQEDTTTLMRRLAKFLERPLKFNFVIPQANSMSLVSVEDPEQACRLTSPPALPTPEYPSLKGVPLADNAYSARLQSRDGTQESLFLEAVAANLSNYIARAISAGCEPTMSPRLDSPRHRPARRAAGEAGA